MTLIHLAGHVVRAEANWSRWIVRCPVCPSADSLERQAPMFGCVECGAVAEVLWPSEEMAYGIERLLMMRPDPSTRNWLPGETLADLMWENGAHGIFQHTTGDLTVEPERIRVDTLPVSFRRELKAIA